MSQLKNDINFLKEGQQSINDKLKEIATDKPQINDISSGFSGGNS